MIRTEVDVALIEAMVDLARAVSDFSDEAARVAAERAVATTLECVAMPMRLIYPGSE